MKNTCEKCKWCWHYDDADMEDETGECHRFPPHHLDEWLIVRTNDFCGEFAKRESKA